MERRHWYGSIAITEGNAGLPECKGIWQSKSLEVITFVGVHLTKMNNDLGETLEQRKCSPCHLKLSSLDSRDLLGVGNYVLWENSRNSWRSRHKEYILKAAENEGVFANKQCNVLVNATCRSTWNPKRSRDKHDNIVIKVQHFWNLHICSGDRSNAIQFSIMKLLGLLNDALAYLVI